MRSCVERYEEVVRRFRPGYETPDSFTPFIDEDCLRNPARDPLLNPDGSSHGYICPHCCEAYGTAEYTYVKDTKEAGDRCKEIRGNG